MSKIPKDLRERMFEYYGFKSKAARRGKKITRRAIKKKEKSRFERRLKEVLRDLATPETQE